MKVVNKSKLIEISKLNTGAVFDVECSFWIISDYEDSDGCRLCIELESGHFRYFSPEYKVIPLPAEVHICYE